MKISYQEMGTSEAQIHKKGLLTAYRSAFSTLPHKLSEDDLVNFSNNFIEMTYRKGFQCVTAVDKELEKIIGFSMGWTSEPGFDWRDNIEKVLKSKSNDIWLQDSFEFALIAVRPNSRHLGIGGHLHNSLLKLTSHHRSILSTLQDTSQTINFFTNRDWQILISDFSFKKSGKSFVIMGYQKPSSYDKENEENK